MEIDQVRCTICDRKFTDPRYFPACLHTFCRDCISRSTQHNDKNKSDGFRCPKCGRISVLSSDTSVDKWTNNLPVNNFMLALIEAERLKKGSIKCGPCSRKKKDAMAVEWCTKCFEAMCGECADFHGSLKTTMKHDIVRISEIKKIPTKDIIPIPSCAHHVGERLVLYCDNHKQLIRALCVTDEHKNCKGVKKVEDTVEARKLGYRSLADGLRQQVTTANIALDNRNEVLTHLNAMHLTLREKVLSVRKEIENILIRSEKKTLDELDARYNRHKTEIERSISDVVSVQEASSNALSILELTRSTGSDSHVIEWMQLISDRNEKYSSDVQKIDWKFKHPQIDFSVHPNLQEALHNVNEIGKFSKEQDSVKSPLSVMSGRKGNGRNNEYHVEDSRRDSLTRDRQFQKRNKDIRSSLTRVNPEEAPNSNKEISLATRKSADYKFSVKTPSDRNSCWMTGVLHLNPSKSWIFADRSNSKLKVFDENFQLKSEVFLTGAPFDISKVKKHEIAVSFPEDRMISFFKVGTGINLTQSIDTDEKCYGLSFREDRFAVTCTLSTPPSVRILSIDGALLNIITPQTTLYPMFIRPMYVKWDKTGSSFYVSDCNTNEISCITRSVLRRFKYMNVDMIGPRGMTMNEEGEIIICGWGSDNIQVVTNSGKFIRELFTRHNGILSPQNVCVTGDNSKILVTLDLTSCDSDYVQIFSIE